MIRLIIGIVLLIIFILGLLGSIFGEKMKKTFSFVIFIVFILLFGCGTKDQDGNSFSTIKIGSQVWMAENLNVEHYRNGDTIPQVQDKGKWASLKTGAWCYYKNDPTNGKKYGKLYNWYAVNDARGLAPEGLHIPTWAEFKTLKNTVGDDGNTLKAIGQGTGGGAGTNTSGFSALLAGKRYFYGESTSLGKYTYFWSSTEYSSTGANFLYLDSSNGANFLYLGSSNYSIIQKNYYKKYGFSVRCLKD